ncbi:hypothetical protein B0H19DRAFT_298177 [Mycena capillaripes]|nr:hypothetical protein B0H19DRAFT_298177 [Mycena capillaripes]
MVGALFLGILLLLRKRAERRKLRVLASRNNIVDFPSLDNPAPVPGTFPPKSKDRPYVYQNVPPSSPPEPTPRRLNDMESAWFLDEGDGPTQRTKPSAGRQTISRTRQDIAPELNSSFPVENFTTRAPSTKTSRQRLDSEQKPSIPVESSAARTPSRKTSRQQLDSEQSPGVPVESSTSRTPSRKMSHQKLDPEPNIPRESSTTRTPSSEQNPSGPVQGSMTRTPSRKTSRRNLDSDHNSSVPRAKATSPQQAPRSESVFSGQVSKYSAPRADQLQPAQEPDPAPSPILFRQPQKPDSVTVIPRPRGSSLRGPQPDNIPAVPPVARHVISVSEDIRPVSRFSISPVAQSFPSRLTLSGHSPSSSTRSPSGRHSRRRGFGSLSGLMHLRSDVAPDVPTDVSSGPEPR